MCVFCPILLLVNRDSYVLFLYVSVVPYSAVPNSDPESLPSFLAVREDMCSCNRVGGGNRDRDRDRGYDSFMVSCQAVSYHIVWYHVVSHYGTSYHIMLSWCIYLQEQYVMFQVLGVLAQFIVWPRHLLHAKQIVCRTSIRTYESNNAISDIVVQETVRGKSRMRDQWHCIQIAWLKCEQMSSSNTDIDIYTSVCVKSSQVGCAAMWTRGLLSCDRW